MTTQELLRQLREKDIRLFVDGERLRSSAPKGSLTPELAGEIAAHKPEILEIFRQARAGEESLVHADRDRPLALSFAQERLWFLNRLQPESTAYNITAIMSLQGGLDRAVLQQALNVLVDRHESLRTTFSECNGDPVTVIAPHAEVEPGFENLEGLSESERDTRLAGLVKAEAQRPFDLARGPLFRVTLVRLEPEHHAVLLAIHHIVSDGRSLGVFFQELATVYRALSEGRDQPLPELAVQYVDYTAWQRQQLTDTVLESELSYWKAKLAGAPDLLALPTDRPRPPAQSFQGAVRQFSLSAEASSALRRLCRETRASAFMTLLAVFQVLLFRYTRQSTILVGTAVENRVRREFEPLIGLLVNTLVLRADVTGKTTGRALIESTRETVLEAHAHQDLPFEKLVGALRPDRTLSHSPLFQVAFVLQNTQHSTTYQTAAASSMFDLSLHVSEDQDGRFHGVFEYSTDLFDEATIDRMGQHYAVLAEALAADPDRPIGRLPLLTAEERTCVLETWNSTATAYPRDRSIHELFSEEAARHPKSIAVVNPGSGRRLTYGALEKESNRLARRLRGFRPRPELRVGVALERSVEAVVALLAVLKAGGAYVPLDPAYPDERLAFMLQAAGIEILITRKQHLDRFPDYKGHLICLDRDQAAISAEPVEPLASAVGPESLAYLIYTSGSSGRPKGVAVPHRAVVRLVKGAEYARFGSGEVFLECAPISFDASTFEIWGSLLNGGLLVLSPHAMPTPRQLADLIAEHGITTIWLTAGLFHQMVDSERERLALVRQILAGGEALSPPHVNRLLEVLRTGVLINGYGPTENTTFTCCHRMTAGTRIGHTVPIGRPISNTVVYVLDADLQPVPVGVPGELFTGGDGLARGYWRREDLNAEKFIDNPFGPGRLYRTGDMVRYRPDGNLEFLGRADNQVKIRGFRIELEEIETVLCLHPLVREAVVAARRDASGSSALHCYYVPRAPLPNGGADLRRYLSSKLPDYMVPSTFVEMESLPLTANGKTDRAALPDPVRIHEGTAPRTSIEAQLVGMWEQVLDVHGIGIRDNFFELGGHSLLAVRLFSRLEGIFGALPISMLFQAPTIEQMAARLSEDGFTPRWRSLVAIQPGGTKPPLFLVPGIGGNVLCYAELSRTLGPDYPIYGLQSLGLDGSHAPLESIEEIAAHFVSEIRTVHPRGPYYLGGACMGGVVAFEMAQQLHAQGETVALLGLMETWPPDAIEWNNTAFQALTGLARRAAAALRALRELPSGERLGFLKAKMASTVHRGAGRDDPESRSESLQEQVAAANFRAVRRYVPRPYSGRLLLVLADGRRPGRYADPRLRWSALAAGNAVIHRIPAIDSGALLKEPHVKLLAPCWRDSLEQHTDTLTPSAP